MNGWILGYLAVHMLGLGVIIAKHGEPRTGAHNAGVALLGSAISLGLLYMGGAFE